MESFVVHAATDSHTPLPLPAVNVTPQAVVVGPLNTNVKRPTPFTSEMLAVLEVIGQEASNVAVTWLFASGEMKRAAVLSIARTSPTVTVIGLNATALSTVGEAIV
jgi:hypothetical protein